MAKLNGINLATPISPGSGSGDIAFSVIKSSLTGSLFTITGDGATTISGSLTVTGSLTAGSFTGSITGTASYATQALSASYSSTTNLTVGSTPITSGTNGRILFQNGGVLQQTGSLSFTSGTLKLISNGGTQTLLVRNSADTFDIFSTGNGGVNAYGFLGISDGANYIQISALGRWVKMTHDYGQLQFTNSLGNNTFTLGNDGISYFSGNVNIGGGTNGARLDVKAQGALSTDLGLRVRNNANTADLFTVAGNGNVNLENLTLQRSTNLQIQLAWQLNQGAGNSIVVSRSNYGVGDTIRYSSAGTWNPLGVGTSNFAGFSFTDTIAQTGSSTGTSRALYVNPTLTSATDWRSIEWTNNTGFGLYGSGDAVNYLKSGLGIGKTTPNAKLDVSGSAIITGSLNVTQGITGSLLGTSSYATQALSASYSSTTNLTVGSTPITSGTNGRILFQNGGVLQQSANLFWDNTNGRLGIGTSSPAGRFQIIAQGTAPTDSVFSVMNSANDRTLISVTGDGTTKIGDVYTTCKLENYGEAKFYASTYGVGHIKLTPWFGNGGTSYITAGTDVPTNGNDLAIQVKRYVTGGNLIFETNDSERMRVQWSGEVGIGTNAPSARLDVRAQGALSTDLALRVRNSANTADLLSVAGNGLTILSGSLNVTQGITGSLLGTSSYATQALSSSFATTASYYGGSVTSASYATTASYVLNAVSASYATQALSASFASTTNLTVGSTPITSGTNGRILFQNGGVLQQTGSLSFGTGLKVLSNGANDSFVINDSTDTNNLFKVTKEGYFYSNYYWQFNRLNGSTLELYSLNTGFSFREGGAPFALLGLNESTFGNTNTNNSVLSIRTSASYGGEYPLGSIIQGLGTNGSVVLSPLSTTSSKAMLGYYNGTSYASALEYNNTSTGGTVVKLLQNGSGAVSIGQSTNGARLDVKAQGALLTDSVFRIRNSANTLDILKIAGNGNLSYYTVGGGITLENYDGTTDIGSTGGSATRINLLANSNNTININVAGTIGTIFNAARGGASGETAFLFNASIGNLAGTTNYGKIINIKDGRTDLGNRANTVIGLSIQRDSTNTNTLLQFQALEAPKGRVSIGWASGTYSGAKFDVLAEGALSTDIAFRIRNSANTGDMLNVKGNGNVQIGVNGISMCRADDPAATRLGNIRYESSDFVTINRSLAVLGGLYGNTSFSTSQVALEMSYTYVGLRCYGGSGNTGFTFNTILPTTGNHFMRMQNGANDLFTILTGGSIGISNSAPKYKLDVSGSARISGETNTSISSSLVVYGSGSAQPVFTVQGSQGELFSVTDSLSGSLFSVNDISGLPIMEVFSDNTTLMGSYQDPMLITTTKLVTTASGAFTLYSLPTASYDTAFFEYSIRSGSNARAGSIMAMQLGSTVNFTETTTTDFGSTSGFGFTVQVAGANMRLTGSATTSGWTIKTIVRSI